MSDKVSMKQPIINFRERKRTLRNLSLSPKKNGFFDENVKLTRSCKKTINRASLAVFEDSDVENRRTPRKKKLSSDEDDTDDEIWQTPTPSKRKCRVPVTTPSTALARLHLNSSEKNKKKPSKCEDMKPRSLFSKLDNTFETEKPLLDEFDLPCRENEVKHLLEMLTNHLENKESGSIYVSGLPGTGKTASLNRIVQIDKIKNGFNIVNINCTSVKSSVSVYKRICQELKLKYTGSLEKNAVQVIESYLPKKHKMILLILDEIDQLETKSQTVLYKLFEWPSRTNSKIVLLGIANAMDLTDRILPRLCAKVELKPVLVHFAPYTRDQIAVILKHKLPQVGGKGSFAPGALELLAAKVASMSGDVRRALDLGRRVMEINTNVDKKQVVAEVLHNEDMIRRSPRKNNQLATECSPKKEPQQSSYLKSPNKQVPDKFTSLVKSSPRKILSSPNKKAVAAVNSPVRSSPRKHNPAIGAKDVLSVVTNLYGGTKNFGIDQETSFPLHQKLAICSFMLILKKGKSKDVTVASLHQVYSRVCSSRGISAVDQSAFLFMCRQLEMTGILQIGKGVGKMAKLQLQWSECEVSDALKDLTLLSSILQDTKCLV